MKSLRGFLRTQYLRKRLEQTPVVVESPVPGTDVSVSFSVHTWVEYHNRAQASFTGEPDMVEWLRTTIRPGDVLWDVGANVGAYSILAAKLCPGARVFAFEPFIPTFAHLWENIVLNGVTAQVFPFCAGLSAHTSPETLAVSDPRAGSSHHQLGQTGGKLQQGVLAARGDDLSSLLGVPRPTMLKLDIDGLEVAAVDGLRVTLGESTLRSVMIEVEEGKSEEQVHEACEGAGFTRMPNPLTQRIGGVFNALYARRM
jgi:FkbM family methyltransferase